MLRLENPPEDLRYRRLIRLNSLVPEKFTEKECNIYNRKYIDLIDDFDSYIMVKHALGYKDEDNFAYEKTFKYKWRVFKWKLKGLKEYIQYLYHLKV